jgi:hypothetical protein
MLDDESQQGDFLSRILRHIPGFGGYLDQAERRENDEKTRNLIAGHLQAGKKAIDDFSRQLLDSGNVEALPACERLRSRLETLIQKVRSGLSGRAEFFRTAKFDEDFLDELYEHDLWTLDESERLAGEIQSMASSKTDAAKVLGDLQERVAAIESKFQDRQRMLTGE